MYVFNCIYAILYYAVLDLIVCTLYRYPDQYSILQVYKRRLCTPTEGSLLALFHCSNWRAVLDHISHAVDRVDGYYALAILSRAIFRRGWRHPQEVRDREKMGVYMDEGENEWMLNSHKILLDRCVCIRNY